LFWNADLTAAVLVIVSPFPPQSGEFMSRRLVVLAAVLSICITSALGAATKTWTGASSANWSDPANWSPSGAPAPGDSLIFPAGAPNRTLNNDLPAGFSVGAMTFNDVYTLNGNDLALGGNVFVDYSVATFDCNVGLKLVSSVSIAGSQKFTINGPVDVNGQTLISGRLTLNGPLNGVGSISGHGDLNLRAGGTFSGTSSSGVNVVGSMPDMNVVTESSPVGGGWVEGSGTLGAVNAAFVSPGDDPSVQRNAHTIGVLNTKSLTIVVAYYVDLTPASGSDSIHVTGTVHVAGQLDVSLPSGSPAIGQSFTIIDNDGSDPISGTFSGLPEGTKIIGNGFAYRISYVGGDGNDVVLTFETGGKRSWTGAASANWSNPANWSPQGAPVPAEDLLFPAGAAHRRRPGGRLQRADIRLQRRNQVVGPGASHWNPIHVRRPFRRQRTECQRRRVFHLCGAPQWQRHH
jgi:hypothetical protein